MKTVINYLNELKEQTGSDYRTAKELEISKEGVSKIRKRGQMSDETAIKIAQLLNIDESEVLIAAAIARSQGEVKKAWEKISKRTATLSALLFCCLLMSYTPDSHASELTNKYTLCEVMEECVAPS